MSMWINGISMQEEKKDIMISLPTKLIEELDAYAKEQKRNRSMQIELFIERGLSDSKKNK